MPPTSPTTTTPLSSSNMSVWESIKALRDFAYKSNHRKVFQDRASWFEKMDKPNYCLWWVPAGHTPSVAEGAKGWSTTRCKVTTPTPSGFPSTFPADRRRSLCLSSSSGDSAKLFVFLALTLRA